MNLIRVVAAAFLLMSFGVFPAKSAPIGPVFPAPGGTGSGFAGDSGLGSGTTLTLSGFDFGAFDQLWWGPANVGSSMDGSNVMGANANMSLATMVGNVAQWTGTTNVATTSGNLDVDTRFTATIQSGAGNWIDPTTVGIPSNPAAVAEITSGPFAVTLLFEAAIFSVDGSGPWMPFKYLFNSLQTFASPANQVQLNFNGQLFYTPTPVPLPAAFPLLGTGLALLGFMGWRRRRREQAV